MPIHTPTRPTIAERHRILMDNADFWIAVAIDPAIQFDEKLREMLRNEFITVREVLSVSPPNGVPRATV